MTQNYTPASDFDPRLFTIVHNGDDIMTSDGVERLEDYVLKEAELMVELGHCDCVTEAAGIVIIVLQDRIARDRRLETLAICRDLSHNWLQTLRRLPRLRETRRRLETGFILEEPLDQLAQTYPPPAEAESSAETEPAMA